MNRHAWQITVLISFLAGSLLCAAELKEPELPFSNPQERLPAGDGHVEISGELKQWHKVTLTLDGPFAHELDEAPNPFTDYRMTVVFKHVGSDLQYTVPGYFAADGNAGETGADRGTKWRAHLCPDINGKWSYRVDFVAGRGIALNSALRGGYVQPFSGKQGSFVVSASDKRGRDFRAHGRLRYVGKHHLQFAQSGRFFLKAGADAPETFLAYKDFDGTYTVKTPLKDWSPHLKDWNRGDPTWQGGKGKGIIGALNYLSGKGANIVSFLTYNAGGDGENVWPFVKRDAKYHYDCSKLDQWQIVLEHAQHKGIYLHFKMQEQEMDDNFKKEQIVIPESLDGGDLGPERALYFRELIARFGHNLALNWNLGEENTQTTLQQTESMDYFREHDPYGHLRVVHTFPNWQDRVYNPLLGKRSFTGVSLQNHWDKAHTRTLQWVKASTAAGHPWVVANDEQGNASLGVPPDPGYQGWDASSLDYDLHDIRKQTLWGTLMAGGAGVEYYFGYKLPQNDLVCQDYRSRDRSWDFCRIALDFFHSNALPFQDMVNRNDLIGNPDHGKEKYCLAQEGNIYVVYLGYVSTSTLDLTDVNGTFSVRWFNPRVGGRLENGSIRSISGGDVVELGQAPSDPDEDWVVLVQSR